MLKERRSGGFIGSIELQMNQFQETQNLLADQGQMKQSKCYAKLRAKVVPSHSAFEWRGASFRVEPWILLKGSPALIPMLSMEERNAIHSYLKGA
jgi:hypothetical protein